MQKKRMEILTSKSRLTMTCPPKYWTPSIGGTYYSMLYCFDSLINRQLSEGKNMNQVQGRLRMQRIYQTCESLPLSN